MKNSTQHHVHVRRRRRGLAGVLAALALVATVAACGDDTSAGTTTPSGSTSALVPPVIVDVTTVVDGMTVGIDLGGTIDITVPEGTEPEWTADIADPTIVHFVPGSVDGSAKFNPGLVGDKAGETTVQIADATSGTTVSFTVQVTGA